MIDAVTSLMSYAVAREGISTALMKQSMKAEEAIAQLLMEVAKNIEQMNTMTAMSGSGGNTVSIYA